MHDRKTFGCPLRESIRLDRPSPLARAQPVLGAPIVSAGTQRRLRRSLLHRSAPTTSRSPAGGSCPPGSGQSHLTAHDSIAPSGSVKITHPFHPLRGKSFVVLKARFVRGVECLVLKGSASGTFAVPRDWTNHARPDAYRDADVLPGFLKLAPLLSLVELSHFISQKRG